MGRNAPYLVLKSFIYKLLLYFFTVTILVYCCIYISFYFIVSSISFIAYVPDTYIKFIIIIKCTACQSHWKSDFGWHLFQK